MPVAKYKSGRNRSKHGIYVLLMLLVSSADAHGICHRDESFDQCLWYDRLSSEELYLHYNRPLAHEAIDVTLYGNLHEHAYYYTIVEIGTPPQKQAVIIDTGSPNVVVTSSLCTHCGHHGMKPLDPHLSQTVSYLKWSEPLCKDIAGLPGKGGGCNFQQTYSEESVVSGTYVKDYLFFESETSPNVMYMLQSIGCIMGETTLIYKQKANGVLGLGSMTPIPDGPSLSVPHDNIKTGLIRNSLDFKQRQDSANGSEPSHNSEREWSSHKDAKRNFAPSGEKTSFIEDYLDWHFPSKKHIFALCFSEHGGILTFGGYPRNLGTVNRKANIIGNIVPAKHMMWAPLTTAGGYIIQIDGMEFAGCNMKVRNHSFVLDSGTTNTLLESPLHNRFTLFFTELCRLLRNNGHQPGPAYHGNTNSDEEELQDRELAGVASASNDNINLRENTYRCGYNPKDLLGITKDPGCHDNSDFGNKSGTDAYTKDENIYHAVKKVYEQIKRDNRCTINPKTGYLCFSDISQMPAVRLSIKG
ncbi:aspartyl protease family protein [Babesia divergens]|uniref:Aspartyl protease family protein n=1 Tax=Babesia divergens TaxID=32595 RepID=A0AAD9G7Q2_BABDI|nr:aspartyl protease family protein [Babesia divergens]